MWFSSNFRPELADQRDTNLDWKSKKVAVIGNGSSGVRIATALQPEASKLINYIRTPTWIFPVFLAEYGPSTGAMGNFTYTEEQRLEFAKKPETLEDCATVWKSSKYILRGFRGIHAEIER